MSRIMSLTPKEDYHLEVVLDNGSSVTLNFMNRLHTARFGMLTDKEFFCCVSTDGKYIRWDNKVEISLNEVIQFLQR